MIIIFGARIRPDGTPSPTLRRRVMAAYAYGSRLHACTYVPTGGVGPFGPSEASVMAALLRESGVSEQAIHLEDTARDTYQSVIACSALLRRLGRDPSDKTTVLVASSAYHLPRCMVLMRLAGWRVRAVPPPKVPAALIFYKRYYWRLREIPAILWDAMLVIAWRLRQRCG